jgi:hypothetical protein
MPTREEAEVYKRRLEHAMQRIVNSTLPQWMKDELINEALDKWKAANDALLGLGIPLEGD